MQQIFIIDFDSAFVEVEGLEELAKIALKDHENTKTQKHEDKIIKEIEKVTRQGMEGKIGFGESLERRVKLLQATKGDVRKLVRKLKKLITPSIVRNREFFLQFSDRIYIVSGGFRDFIWPVVSGFGIKKSHVLANEFVFDKEGNIVGYDRENPLAGDKGKIRAIREIREIGEIGEIWVIGDGYTDYEIKKEGKAEKFFALTENVYREAVAQKADRILPNFDEFLYLYKLPRALSYPKHRIKALLLENIHPGVEQIFAREGYVVKKRDNRVRGAPNQSDVTSDGSGQVPGIEGIKEIEGIEDKAILCLGGKEIATEELLNKARRLWVVGVFSGRVDQVDLAAATKRGVGVFRTRGRGEAVARKLAKKVINFINSGDTTDSVNLPNLALPGQENTHRFIHIHKNVPGVLAEINGVIGKAKINIEGQYLRTNSEVGYLVTDVNKEYPEEVVKELRKVKGTIRLRVLY